MTANVATLFTPPTKWHPGMPIETRPPRGLTFDRDVPTVHQAASWTCSCAAMAWVMNSLGVPAPTPGPWDEWDAVNELRRLCGYAAVTPDYGLAYASGIDLERVYNEYGFVVERFGDPDWNKMVLVTDFTIGQIGGARWYHWSGLRGFNGLEFNLANPAPSWKGVGSELSQYEWDTWGRWNAVMIVGVR